MVLEASETADAFSKAAPSQCSRWVVSYPLVFVSPCPCLMGQNDDSGDRKDLLQKVSLQTG